MRPLIGKDGAPVDPVRRDRPSMRALGLVQGRARILGQIRMQELGRLRDRQTQIVEILQLRLQPLPATAEEMAAALAVVCQKMQMPAGDIDAAGGDQKPTMVPVTSFILNSA